MPLDWASSVALVFAPSHVISSPSGFSASQRAASRLMSSPSAGSRPLIDDNPIFRRIVGEGSDDPPLALKNTVAARDHIGGAAIGNSRFVARGEGQHFGRGVVIEDDQEIDIAVRPALAARRGAEKNHAKR